MTRFLVFPLKFYSWPQRITQIWKHVFCAQFRLCTDGQPPGTPVFLPYSGRRGKTRGDPQGQGRSQAQFPPATPSPRTPAAGWARTSSLLGRCNRSLRSRKRAKGEGGLWRPAGQPAARAADPGSIGVAGIQRGKLGGGMDSGPRGLRAVHAGNCSPPDPERPLCRVLPLPHPTPPHPTLPWACSLRSPCECPHSPPSPPRST
jgi:hypothetical protein